MDKEKQIEEVEEMEAIRQIAEILTNSSSCTSLPCCECEFCGEPNCTELFKAKAVYNAGYRKQSEGEWEYVNLIVM